MPPIRFNLAIVVSFLFAQQILISKNGNAQIKPPASTVAGYPVNYNEDSVGNYVLPDVLALNNGKNVTDTKTWTEIRRPELVKLFAEQQFGKRYALRLKQRGNYLPLIEKLVQIDP